MRHTDLDSEWDLDAARRRPPLVEPPTLSHSSISSAVDARPRGKRRRLAAGSKVPWAARARGFRRVVAPPNYSVGKRPLPGVAPLDDPASVVAAKIIATFPPASEAVRRARRTLERTRTVHEKKRPRVACRRAPAQPPLQPVKRRRRRFWTLLGF